MLTSFIGKKNTPVSEYDAYVIVDNPVEMGDYSKMTEEKSGKKLQAKTVIFVKILLRSIRAKITPATLYCVAHVPYAIITYS